MTDLMYNSVERLAMLAAIKHEDPDDTPRLAFADWADESGDYRDRAHAEFIRMGCTRKPKGAITKKEGIWLEANWTRLLPAIARSRPSGPMFVPKAWRTGRWITFRSPVDPRDHVEVVLEFFRGFLRTAIYDIPQAVLKLGPLICHDDPTAKHLMAGKPYSYGFFDSADHEDGFRRRYAIHASHWSKEFLGLVIDNAPDSMDIRDELHTDVPRVVITDTADYPTRSTSEYDRLILYRRFEASMSLVIEKAVDSYVRSAPKG